MPSSTSSFTSCLGFSLTSSFTSSLCLSLTSSLASDFFRRLWLQIFSRRLSCQQPCHHHFWHHRLIWFRFFVIIFLVNLEDFLHYTLCFISWTFASGFGLRISRDAFGGIIGYGWRFFGHRLLGFCVSPVRPARSRSKKESGRDNTHDQLKSDRESHQPGKFKFFYTSQFEFRL